jgi:hypothetical protein
MVVMDADKSRTKISSTLGWAIRTIGAIDGRKEGARQVARGPKEAVHGHLAAWLSKALRCLDLIDNS